MRWQVPRIWEGGDVWILGGGPSVTQQFDIPDNIVQDVLNKVSPPAVYSPYMESIHKKHVIAINAAFLIGDWMDMVFFGDHKFLTWYKDQLAAWPGLKITCSAGCEKYAWIKFLQRDGGHSKGISPNPNMVAWNANSGCSAISVAANAGAKRIILVGFDMKVNGSGAHHWHTLYKGQPTNPPPPPPHRPLRMPQRPKPGFPFQRHLAGFPQITLDARARGIEIINACPDSAITQFSKCNVKDLL